MYPHLFVLAQRDGGTRQRKALHPYRLLPQTLPLKGGETVAEIGHISNLNCCRSGRQQISMYQGGTTICAPRPTPRPPQEGVACKIQAHNAERARFCDISCSNLCGAAGAAVRSSVPGFVSLVSCKTHLARLCQERPPDGGHRLRQQTSGGDPSFSGGYHRLFPQKEMGVHIPCGPKGRSLISAEKGGRTSRAARKNR